MSKIEQYVDSGVSVAADPPEASKQEVNTDVVEEKVVKTQARRWMITINNEERTDDQLCEYIRNLEHFKYYVFQREKGNETGTEHIQLFLVFSIGKRFETVKRYFERAHIEKARGSNVQCRDYCTKSDTRISGPYEEGNFAEERARTDLTNFYEMIDLGATDNEIRTAYPGLYSRYYNLIEAERQKNLAQKYDKCFRDVEVTYLYGPPGCGKSTYVVNEVGFGNFFRVVNYKKNPFDGYKGEDVIWLEEFHSQFNVEFFLTLVDRFPMTLPCRYSDKVACFTKIYITTNIPPDEQYPQSEYPSQHAAYIRRLGNIGYMDANHQIVWLKKLDRNEQITMLGDAADDIFETQD